MNNKADNNLIDVQDLSDSRDDQDLFNQGQGSTMLQTQSSVWTNQNQINSLGMPNQDFKETVMRPIANGSM